jgi:hypothetical protein
MQVSRQPVRTIAAAGLANRHSFLTYKRYAALRGLHHLVCEQCTAASRAVRFHALRSLAVSLQFFGRIGKFTGIDAVR